MIDNLSILSIICCVAFVIKGVTGFGENLIIIPLMLFFYDMKIILPLVIILNFIADLFLFFQCRCLDNIDKPSIKLLLGPAIIGVFLGANLLNMFTSNIIKIIYALFITFFSIKMLLEKETELKNTINHHWGIVAGFFGGLLSSLFGTGGPPVVMYLNYINAKKEIFRATNIAIFLIFDISRIIAYASLHLFSKEVVLNSIYLVPGMVIGSLIGVWAHTICNEQRFKQTIAILLFGIGLSLLKSSFSV